MDPEELEEEEQEEPESDPEPEPEPEPVEEPLEDEELLEEEALEAESDEELLDVQEAATQAEYEDRVTGFEDEEPADEQVEATVESGADEAADLAADLAVGAMAMGAVAMIGEANAAQNEREAKKREQEEARRAREEERARLAEERKKEMEEARKAKEEERANRPRPSFGESLRSSEPPAEPRSASGVSVPPPPVFPPAEEASAAGAEIPAAQAPDADEVAAEGAAAVAAAEGNVGRIPRSTAPRAPRAAAAGGSSGVSDERAAREAARKEMMESKKAEADAKKAEREALQAQKAAERKAAFEGANAARGERSASHASDFSDLRGTGIPAAPAAGNSAMAEKMAKLAAGGGGMAQALSSKLAQAKADSAGPAIAAPAKAAPAAPLPPGANDYLDIIQHLEARAAFHPEYGEIREKYESRLLVGGEVLQCTLVGLNAGLIDSVYRKLSKIPSFMELVDWKYVAIEPVIVVSENGQKRDVRVDTQSTISIGRDPSCTIALSASFVSRNHAEIRNLAKNPNLPPQWQLKDLGSTHGTTLNGSVVRDAVRFGSEDRIELGRGYAATEYPSLQLISRAIPYGRDDLNRMVVDVDLVIAVVEADREFEGQANLLKNLSEVQNVGGLLVLAVSKSGAIDSSMDANLDELRHAARVLKSTELTRYLAAVDEDDISTDGEWLDSAKEFIEGFRGRSHAGIQEKRKQITREEVVSEIRNAGTRLEDTLSKKLEESERNLQRVQDEISMAPRNLGSAESLRDDTFKALKQTLDDDTSFFADPLRPDSLTYYADRLASQLVVVKKGKTRLELFLVDPHSKQEPHRWINNELSIFARRHFDELLAQITGPQKEPHGITGLYQSLRELLGGHDKLRNTDLFSDDNYQRYTVSELSRQLHTALGSDFVEYEAKTFTKIDNMIMFVITKTRFAVMFYMSMFSIVGVIIGSTRSKISRAMNDFFGGKFFMIAIPILIVVCYFTVKSYKVNTQDVIEEETDKLREQLSKHYQAVAKKFVDDAKRVLSIHLSTQESKIKQDMGTLGSSRMAGGLAERNNPVLEQAKKERDDVQALIYAIGQERAWAEQAQRQYTPSPFVQVQPVRRTTTTR